MSKFNYCLSLVWIYSSTKSLKKIENFQKEALRFLLNEYAWTYEDLLEKANRSSMNVNRLQLLCAEIYKTVNNLIKEMKEIFALKETKRSIREQ